MPDEADFIRAVIARPDDDAPRLVYADWLEENGQDERAEFIRVQCRLAACPTPLCASGNFRRADGLGGICYACGALRRRERELLGTHALEWSDPIMATGLAPACTCFGDGIYGYGDARWFFRRGFVETVTCTAEDWLAHADAILQAQPVREVTLTTMPEWEHELTMDRTRLRGRGYWHSGEEMRLIVGGMMPDWLQKASEHMLRAEWSSVKTWHLPPAEDHARLRQLTFEATQRAAREAVRRVNAGASVTFDPTR